MSSILALLVLIAPLSLTAVAMQARREPGLRPHRILLTSRLATLGSLLVAIIAGIAVAVNGPMTSTLLGYGEFGLSIRLDALSAVMFLLVSFVGALVIQFSRNYLDGDERQGAFFGGLCLTLAAVSLLVLSGNLFQLVAAWIATSLALHQLLVFYPDRKAAVTAARKKFITARLGDVCLIGAAVLLAIAFGTSDIAMILSAARETDLTSVPAGVPFAALLLAIAALLKSAQFPFHGWLPEVMETPTPVSALLHAGIINAGGFLIIRFADVMMLSASSMHVLALVGGFTALFGAVVMLTQTSVKVSLAWSTVAQMGFMLLQCGLGAFALAVLHIVAHSLYKAHAFLSSGSVVEIARASWVPDMKARPKPSHVVASLAMALGLYLGFGWAFGLIDLENTAYLVLGAILVMGVTLLLAQSTAGNPNAYVLGRTAAAAAVVTVAYFGLQAGVTALMSPSLPLPHAPGVADILIMAFVVVSFALVTTLQILAPTLSDASAWRAARVHIANGLYANALFNRLVGALTRPAANSSQGASHA